MFSYLILSAASAAATLFVSASAAAASASAAYPLVDQTIADEWKPIVDDILDPHPVITSDDTSRLLDHWGTQVLIQKSNDTLYLVDPNEACTKNNTAFSWIATYLRWRCNALFHLLSAALEGVKGDAEYVVNLDDFPPYHADGRKAKAPLAPAFGAVRCWSKGTIAIPFYGSHSQWSFEAQAAKAIGVEQTVPFRERAQTAIFRGGAERGCSVQPNVFKPGEVDFVVPTPIDYSKTERPNCGRWRLKTLAEESPSLIDYKTNASSFISLYDQTRIYRYIISAEGYGGWADRLEELMGLPATVFNQDHPCEMWHEPLAKPFVHYIPFLNDMSDLEGRILWANAHPRQAEQISIAGKRFSQRYLSPVGVVSYLHSLLASYTSRFSGALGYRTSDVAMIWKALEASNHRLPLV